MTLFNIPDLFARLLPEERLIGLDPGQRQVGVALTDVRRRVASPYATLRRGKLSVMAAEIRAIADKEGAGGLVVGLPLSLDGSFGPAAQASRDWTIALSDMTGLPAANWDERLSSSAVNRALIQEADMTRTRRQEVVDRAAAAYMLQGVLDFVSYQEEYRQF
ncbi:Holliday junction resolvase RuvX [Acetobacter sp. AN02]|uniref:Holliday junction resolvase RuvX n=1 Tax=Acetobacter sp. AN02 TaxID=2894186 RepID=UPI0024343A46|nr:Holliday junction resolvase RuvX [Acetobacter sp. AN02]MDG6095626.1 Holliday junction resolvase RuvX [Acetobacter sp. AN02]